MGEPTLPPGVVPTFPSQNEGSGGLSGAAQMAIQIINQASQGVQNPIVNRPQVMLPTPRMPQQIPMGTPSGNVNATTRAGQRRNDLNTLISSVGNVVKAGINKQRQNQERDLMHDLAVIQAAASNPDDPHNKMILDKMMNDSKVVKRLQKALGYNPLSGEEAPPEAKTLQKFSAQQQIKQQQQQTQQSSQQQQPQSGTAMQNLLSRMPNTQQINPVVAMQAELIKAGILPKNDLGPKALLDFVQEAMKDETKREEIKARAEATNNQTLMRLYDTLIRAQSYMERGEATDKSRETVARIHADATKYAADARERSAAKRLDSKYGANTFKNLKVVADIYNQDIQRLEEQLSTSLKQSGGKDTDETKRLRDEIRQKQSMKNSVEDILNKELQASPQGGVQELEQQTAPSSDEDMQFGDYIFGTENHK